MADTAGAPEEERVPVGRIVLYSAPVLGVFGANSLISFYLLKYATDVLLIAPVAIGTLFLVGRIWDAVSDPVVGHLSDRTRTRMGRRRPWFLFSALPLAATVVAVWSPPEGLGPRGLVAWLSVAFLLYLTFYTTFRVPHMALGAELSRGYHDRTRVFGIMQVVECFGIVAGAAGLAVIENAELPRRAASLLSIGIAVSIVVLLLVTTALLREREEFQGRGHAGSRRAFREVLVNPHARLLVVVFFLEQLGFAALLGLLPYVSDYVLLTPGRTSVYLIGAIAAQIFSIPLWIVLSRRFGKKPVWSFSLAAKIATFGALYLIGPGDLLAMVGVVIAFGFLSACGSVVGPSLKADVIDWDEGRSGERKEGAYFATWNFSQKAAAGVSVWMIGAVLQAVGFVPNAEQSDGALLGIRATVSLWPMALHALAFLLVRRFALDESAHRLARRRADRQASSGASRGAAQRGPEAMRRP